MSSIQSLRQTVGTVARTWRRGNGLQVQHTLLQIIIQDSFLGWFPKKSCFRRLAQIFFNLEGQLTFNKVVIQDVRNVHDVQDVCNVRESRIFALFMTYGMSLVNDVVPATACDVFDLHDCQGRRCFNSNAKNSRNGNCAKVDSEHSDSDFSKNLGSDSALILILFRSTQIRNCIVIGTDSPLHC